MCRWLRIFVEFGRLVGWVGDGVWFGCFGDVWIDILDEYVWVEWDRVVDGGVVGW